MLFFPGCVPGIAGLYHQHMRGPLIRPRSLNPSTQNPAAYLGVGRLKRVMMEEGKVDSAAPQKGPETANMLNFGTRGCRASARIQLLIAVECDVTEGHSQHNCPPSCLHFFNLLHHFPGCLHRLATAVWCGPDVCVGCSPTYLRICGGRGGGYFFPDRP